MCPKCDECSHIDSREEKHGVDSCPSSVVTNLQISTISTMPESSGLNFVYSRRKRQGNSNTNAFFTEKAPASTTRTGDDSVSVVSSCAPSFKDQPVISQGGHVIKDPDIPLVACNGESHRFISVEERFSDQASKNTMHKIIDVDSINDSCSSSKSYMELTSTSLHTEVEDASECSSSVMVLEALGEDSCQNELCVSENGIQGVSVLPNRTDGSADDICDGSGSSNFRICKICARPESPHKLLICDNCEEAFHLSCCTPRVKRIPQDEWFCHSCLKKRNILAETSCRKFLNMIGDKGRCGHSSMSESNSIALMLRDTGPYITSVRIGKGFQAEVPDWSGPITDDTDTFGEALEMDPSDFAKSTELKLNKSPQISYIGNWLQCREIIDGAGESANGVICGKWRRAPLFEVQTDNWECFCSVLWDPSHADCAVLQELDTDQVQKQLKYVQMLRPRLAAKRRKLEQKKNDKELVQNFRNDRNVRTRH